MREQFEGQKIPAAFLRTLSCFGTLLLTKDDGDDDDRALSLFYFDLFDPNEVSENARIVVHGLDPSGLHHSPARNCRPRKQFDVAFCRQRSDVDLQRGLGLDVVA